MNIVEFNYEKKYINDFIALPKKLYNKENNMEDSSTIKKLLLNKHPLSKYFKLNKFLIYDDSKVVGRFIITEYKDKDECYIGFFECINDSGVAKYLFDEAYKFADKKGYKKIIGPVDASFWLKYRLKINKFDLIPYTGEPYNLDYYYKLFLDNKYEVCEHYTSNQFQKADASYNNAKFWEHYNEFIKKGYEIKRPNDNEFDKCIKEIYYLIMDLYSDFPVFNKLELEDFIKVFNSYKAIINMDMVRMAYYHGRAVGFYISIPNYNNIVYHLNLSNILKIIKTRKNPKGYVMLYMGVDKNHTGLGKALVCSIVEELKKSHLPSIGALARDGKITQKYGEEMISSQYEYVLLERKI